MEARRSLTRALAREGRRARLAEDVDAAVGVLLAEGHLLHVAFQLPHRAVHLFSQHSRSAAFSGPSKNQVTLLPLRLYVRGTASQPDSKGCLKESRWRAWHDIGRK